MAGHLFPSTLGRSSAAGRLANGSSDALMGWRGSSKESQADIYLDGDCVLIYEADSTQNRRSFAGSGHLRDTPFPPGSEERQASVHATADAPLGANWPALSQARPSHPGLSRAANPFVSASGEAAGVDPTKHKTGDRGHRAGGRRDQQNMLQINVTERLAEIRVPVWVTVGEHNLSTTVQHARRIVANLLSADIVVLSDAAHLSNVEQPELFNRAPGLSLDRIK
jgi:pimeloyl-ACP methyl ester carboxylesterase